MWQPLLSFHFPFHYPSYIGLLTRKNNLWQPHQNFRFFLFFPPILCFFFAFPNFAVSHWTQISRVFNDFWRIFQNFYWNLRTHAEKHCSITLNTDFKGFQWLFKDLPKFLLKFKDIAVSHWTQISRVFNDFSRIFQNFYWNLRTHAEKHSLFQWSKQCPAWHKQHFIFVELSM